MRRAPTVAWFPLLLLGLLLDAGCASTPLVIDLPPPSGAPSTPAGSFRAGAAKVDITPIPGIPLGGYSIDGKFSRGFWTRLYARALYLEDASQKPLVLISTDLSAISGGLGDEVARLLHAEHGLTWIGREHVLASSTHTHHGPGNYYSDKMFNQAPSPAPNFDEALFHFLAGRIAFAVKKAVDNAAPAELLSTDASVLDVSKDWKLHNFFRNRSLEPFLLNPSAASFLDPDISGTCPPGPGQVGGKACLAVRPQVELMAVRHTGSSKFIGVAAFVPVHPTVLPSRLEVFSSDLFGVAAIELESPSTCSAQLEPNAVVGFFNGAEGDVSPTWTLRNRKEVVTLGGMLAAKVCALLAGVKMVDSAIDARYERIEVAGQSFVEEVEYLDETGAQGAALERRTTKRGSSGAAAVGGAEDGRSILYKLLGHREGFTRQSRRDHGPKSHVGQIEGMGIKGNPLKPILWDNPPPDKTPIAVYKIGGTAPNLVIAALPGEFTTQMGRRVRREVFSRLPPSDRPAKAEHVLLVGLANEYLGYITTPEEYDAQHYEGAMTLYGPASGPFLSQKLGDLAAQPGPVPPRGTSWSHEYDPGKTSVFQPRDVWGPLHYKDDGLADLTQDLAAEPNVRRDLPVFCWRDALPRLEALSTGSSCQRSNPEVSVTTKFAFAGGTIWAPLDDNFGLDVVTAVTGVGKDGTGGYRTEWCAIWLGATDYLEPVRTNDYRFEVKRLEGTSTEVSSTFGVVDSEPDGWIDKRFLQHPAQALDPSFPPWILPMSPVGQCTVPPPS